MVWIWFGLNRSLLAKNNKTKEEEEEEESGGGGEKFNRRSYEANPTHCDDGVSHGASISTVDAGDGTRSRAQRH